MKVVYKSAIVEKIIMQINHAAKYGWPIEHIELTHSEWFLFKSYLVLLMWPIQPMDINTDSTKFHGVKIIREG